MSRAGSRISRRCTRSIPTARARWRRLRPTAGTMASRPACSTACPSRSRTTSPPRASRCRWVRQACRWCPAERDAPPVARLREAGAVIFSKTTMPDYGMLSSGLSSFHPLTRNPWDLGKNPGGSSAGAGAAAAAGYGPLHLGTDIGGSVRLPACWCGLVALKPSLGRVPVDPPYVGRVAGPMTRTVDDAALMMSVLSKPDRRDGMSLPAHDINWKALDKSPRKLRLGLMLDAAGQALEKPVRDVVDQGRQGVRSRRRRHHRSRRHLDPRDARRRRQFLPRAAVGRSGQAAREGARQDAALYPAMGGSRRKAFRRRCHQRLQPDHGDPRCCGKTVLRARLFDLAGLAGGEFPGGVRRAAERSRKSRSSISATPCRGTCRRTRPCRSMAATTSTVFRSACRSSAAASTTSACSAWPRHLKACAARKNRGRRRRRSSIRHIPIPSWPGLTRPSSLSLPHEGRGRLAQARA